MARLPGKFRVGEETKHPETVIKTHHHHALFCQVLTVLARFGSRASGETSPIDPHHDWQTRLHERRGRPHAQAQAVFAGPVVAEHHVVVNAGLHAARPKLGRFVDSTPLPHGLGSFPAQSADGWRREGNAFENVYLRIAAHGALNQTGIGKNDSGTRGNRGRHYRRGAARGIAQSSVCRSRHGPAWLYQTIRNAGGRAGRSESLCPCGYRQETRRQEEKHPVKVNLHNTALMSPSRSYFLAPILPATPPRDKGGEKAGFAPLRLCALA